MKVDTAAEIEECLDSPMKLSDACRVLGGEFMQNPSLLLPIIIAGDISSTREEDGTYRTTRRAVQEYAEVLSGRAQARERRRREQKARDLQREIRQAQAVRREEIRTERTNRPAVKARARVDEALNTVRHSIRFSHALCEYIINSDAQLEDPLAALDFLVELSATAKPVWWQDAG